jgi:nucleoid-associated protein YgaU
MKRFVLAALLIVAAGLSLLPAQSLADNSYFKRSVELQALADKSFDDGDYDAAADYAAQAQEYAGLSNKFVEKMVAMNIADKAIATARTKGAAIDQAQAQKGWPSQYATATDAFNAALAAYKAEDYKTATAKAEAASAAWDSLQAAMLAVYNQTLADKAEADKAMAEAKARLAWAESVKAPKTFPKEYAKASSEMDASNGAYSGENYPSATDHAKAVLVALSGVTDTIPFPAVYTVRLIPARRDCLWRIAEYPFIYNNPLKWTVIYEANKSTFKDPSNPNLIFPGQILKIPAIKGEVRDGVYDPTKDYPVLPKK